MSLRKVIIFILMAFAAPALFAQVETIPLNHDVYKFLHRMKVEGIIGPVHSYNPQMSRGEVLERLKEVQKKKGNLSSLETGFLEKYLDEFDFENRSGNMAFLLGENKELTINFADAFSNKPKYLYRYADDNFNAYLSPDFGFFRSQKLSGRSAYNNYINAAPQFWGSGGKIGFHIGLDYLIMSSNREFAGQVFPWLRQSYKYVENMERINVASSSTGYVRFETGLWEGSDIAVQLGREKVKYGFGYLGNMVLSGENPDMDFIKLDFTYGILNFFSFHGSTVGEYHENRDLNYTKYLALHGMFFSIPGLFDIGIGESIIYSKRGIEIGYLNPLGFYKYLEMSMQDRDNGLLWLGFQSNFLKNVELQATFLMDETVKIPDPDNFINKWGFQGGVFVYSPFGLDQLNFSAEYTKLRPFVYSHIQGNSYTAFGRTLGHRTGPNSDETAFKIGYAFSPFINVEVFGAYSRRGENIYDDNGELIYNAGSNIDLPYEIYQPNDDKHIPFLSGERYDNYTLEATVEYEYIRDFIIQLIYHYDSDEHLDSGNKTEFSYGLVKLIFAL